MLTGMIIEDLTLIVHHLDFYTQYLTCVCNKACVCWVIMNSFFIGWSHMDQLNCKWRVMGIVRFNESLLIFFFFFFLSTYACPFLWLQFSLRLNVFSKIFDQIVGQFRALADQLFRSPEYHKHVRKQVIKQVQLIKLH